MAKTKVNKNPLQKMHQKSEREKQFKINKNKPSSKTAALVKKRKTTLLKTKKAFEKALKELKKLNNE